MAESSRDWACHKLESSVRGEAYGQWFGSNASSPRAYQQLILRALSPIESRDEVNPSTGTPSPENRMSEGGSEKRRSP